MSCHGSYCYPGKAKDKVSKVSYVVQGLFQIVRGTRRGSYIVRKMNKPDSTELRFMSEDLYILPPSLKPCEPIDSSDNRYLNQSHALVVNPLKNLTTSNCIKKKVLTNHLKPSLHHLSMIMLL